MVYCLLLTFIDPTWNMIAVFQYNRFIKVSFSSKCHGVVTFATAIVLYLKGDCGVKENCTIRLLLSSVCSYNILYLL